MDDTLLSDDALLSDRAQWAKEQFATAKLGDSRRAKRLVTVAETMANNTSGSIPQQTGGGAEMKAAYRLFDADGVTHEAVCKPHFDQTRRLAGQLPMVFLLQDTTELNFTSHHACQGLGPIGKGGHMRGLHQQNILAVDPVSRRPLGLMYQRHHRRTERPKGHKRQAVPLEERESYWWIDAIRAIGEPPEGGGVRWVHVGDRGEDIFGVYDEARRQGTDWLIRVSQDRRIFIPDKEGKFDDEGKHDKEGKHDGKSKHVGEGKLMSYARSLPVRVVQTVPIRRRPKGEPEEVRMCVSGGRVQLRPSQGEACYKDCEPVACWVVRVWEAPPQNPPAGRKPLEWILCTSLPCDSDEILIFAAQGYALRWLIEEFHKCEKTGCQVEQRRLETLDRLEPLIGLLSVLAVWLLQLKYVARDDPGKPAKEMFEEPMVRVMARYLKRPAMTLTLGEFWRGIGRLGGHPGRKCDGPIGWLRAWRGWQSFQLIMLGAELSSE